MSKQVDKRKTFARLLKYLAKYPFQLAFIVFLVIISGFVNVFGIYQIHHLIDDYILTNRINELSTPLLQMAIMFMIGAGSSAIYNPLMVKLSQKIISEIRNELFSHMEYLPVSYFDRRNRGDIMSYFTNDIDTLNEALNTGFTTIIFSLVTATGTIVFLFLINIYLSLIVIFFILLMFLFLRINTQKAKRYFRETQREVAELNSYVEEMTMGLKVSDMFMHHEEDLAKFDVVNKNFADAATKAHENALRVTPIIVSLSYFNYAISSVTGALFALNGLINLGALASYLIYVRQSSNPFNQITNQLNALYNGIAGAERIFNFLDEKQEVDEGKITLVSAVTLGGEIVETMEPTPTLAWKIPTENGFTYKKFVGDVIFDKVSFGYEPGALVLKNVSLYASKGEKIALVGSTGAGKTTIINLITRFYEINSGTITYDGIDIREIKKDDLRRSVSVVIQDTHLFTGSILSNITYASPGTTIVEAKAAAKISNAAFFIEHLPNGYETIVTDNASNLSSGQRQLLALARAAIVQPPVLILDEATSNIDTRSELLIQKAMDELMEDKTVFVIAHRLSTIKNAKAILVLEKGEIIERGSHDELINEKRVYYELYTGQFEWT